MRLHLAANKSIQLTGGLAAWLLCVLASPLAAATTVTLQEASIEQINAAFAGGTFTSEKLVAMYLKRVVACDQKSPAINTVITLNPNALETAKALDKELKTKGPRSPLHGMPVVLKDNFDTFDLPTDSQCMQIVSAQPLLPYCALAAAATLVAAITK